MSKHICTCSACEALAKRYKSDPVLLAHYRKKLLIPEWAGEMDAAETAYFRAHNAQVAGRRAASTTKPDRKPQGTSKAVLPPVLVLETG